MQRFISRDYNYSQSRPHTRNLQAEGRELQLDVSVGGTYSHWPPSNPRKLSTYQSASRFDATSFNYSEAKMTTRIHPISRVLATAAALTATAILAGCVEAPPRVYREPPPQPNTDVYAYPQQGQTAQQQDRDRYDCHLWAVGQSGFDPSAPGVPPHDRVRVVSAGPPPGAGTAVGAIAGAIFGAAVSGPRNAGVGALVGAVAGGAIGNASEQAQAQANAQQAVNVQDARANAIMEQKATNYRRAIGACLEGRGYTVK